MSDITIQEKTTMLDQLQKSQEKTLNKQFDEATKRLMEDNRAQLSKDNLPESKAHAT